MPGEAEISFEEATGGSAASTPSAVTSSPVSPQKGEISFAEAAGPVAPSGPSLGERVSAIAGRASKNYEAYQQGRSIVSQRDEQLRRGTFTNIFGELEETPGEGFAAHAGKAALRGLRALVTSPTKAVAGGVKALAGGAISMAEQIPAGIRGLGRLGGEALIRETVGRIPAGATTAPFLGAIHRAAETQPLDAAVSEIETSMQETAAMKEVASKITNINLATETEQDKAMEGLLMVIPEGITAAGDTVYEKTGSALAGAGTQGLLTLLTFKPQLAGKVVAESIKSVKSKELFNTTFDALSVSEPDAAKSVIEHIATTDPKTASKLRMRFDQASEKWVPSELGEKVVKQQTKGKELTPEEVGVGLSETATETPKVESKVSTKQAQPELIIDEDVGQFEVKAQGVEFLAQENRNYLQIKRADVVAAERGKGRAQEAMAMLAAEAERRGLILASDFSVSQAAQRVYEALKKKGWEVKENPSTPGVNGSKVSTDPRVPVYEVTKPKVQTAKPASIAEIPKVTDNQLWMAYKKGKTDIAGTPNPILLAAKEATVSKFDKAAFEKFLAEQRKTEEPVAVAEQQQSPPVEQIFIAGSSLDAIPGGQFIKGKMAAWWDELTRTLNPEGLGPKAKIAAATTAEHIARTMNADVANHGMALERRAFWEKQTPEAISQFMKQFETGKPQATTELQKIDAYLRQRNQEIFAQDKRNGIQYDPVDNYLYHVFENGDKLSEYFQAKYGAKWGDPKFTKDRQFELYEEAVKAGYRPKFNNIEDLMLARQHASNMAEMQVELLKDLETYGVAKEKTKANPDPPKDGRYVYRRSPNGKGYWVEASAMQILHNAFDTKSLWNMAGIRGDLFRGAMFLKNSTVPFVLGASLFHPLHLLLGMDSAAAMTRLTKEMLVSGMNPVKWFGKWLEQMTLGAKGIPLYGIIDNPRLGFRLFKALRGRIDPAQLSAADRVALQYMTEGGFVPEQAAHYRSNAMEHFRQAVRQVAVEYNSGRRGIERAVVPALKAGFFTPFAIIDAMQFPMFRRWIPALKIVSYLKDVQTAVKLDPTLVSDKARRILLFRRLAKSVDNRYGEMNYNTLFWNKTIKDIGVANTLSLGWNLGFLREYGGGVLDIGQSAVKKGSLSEKVKAGQLDRPLFVMFYTTQVMLYSGLLTWALTGKMPTDFMDYLYPKSGDKDEQGRDERLTTPFYPREFAAIAKHIEHEGVAGGLWHTVSNKSSGVIGLVSQAFTGVDWRDQEIRDPNSPWHQQMRATIAATLGDLQPISIEQLRRSEKTAKDVVTAFTGFGPAPKYVAQTDTEASISQLYRKYYAPKQTPYEKALVSNDRRELAKLYDQGKTNEFSDLLDEMAVKYDLTAQEQGQLSRNIMRRGSDYNPYLTMFERLTWQQQKRLLDKMPQDERDVYLPHANRQHLRYTYEEPR